MLPTPHFPMVVYLILYLLIYLVLGCLENKPIYWKTRQYAVAKYLDETVMI